MNATNTPDTTLREALKAAQAENTRLREYLEKMAMLYEWQKKYEESMCLKLLDRERRLKAIQESMTTSFDTGQRAYKIILNACDLNKPLEGE